MKNLLFIFSFVLSFFFWINGFSQCGKSIKKRLKESNSPIIKKVIDSPDKYRVQIIYTQIKRKKNGKIKFSKYTYRLQKKEYFYPASLVKLPAAILALHKLNEMDMEGLNKSTCMKTDSAYACQTTQHTDTTSSTGKPSLEHYIKKMLLVSDNVAFNRVYEFLGQEYIHTELKKRGYRNARIIQRLWACDTLMNRHTNPIEFYDEKGKLIYRQEAQFYPKQLSNPKGDIYIGKGRMRDTFIEYKPKNFRYNNAITLDDETELLKSVLFPESVKKKRRFNLTESDYIFLRKYLAMYPSESDYPKYTAENGYYDAWKKYIYYGRDSTVMGLKDSGLIIHNIVGQALGFTADCAHFCNYVTGTQFMLSVVIYTNEDGILYDDKYEYYSVALPFLKALGREIYQYEKNRKK